MVSSNSNLKFDIFRQGRSLSVVENSAVQNDVGNALRKVRQQVCTANKLDYVGYRGSCSKSEFCCFFNLL